MLLSFCVTLSHGMEWALMHPSLPPRPNSKEKLHFRQSKVSQSKVQSLSIQKHIIFTSINPCTVMLRIAFIWCALAALALNGYAQTTRITPTMYVLTNPNGYS